MTSYHKQCFQKYKITNVEQIPTSCLGQNPDRNRAIMGKLLNGSSLAFAGIDAGLSRERVRCISFKVFADLNKSLGSQHSGKPLKISRRLYTCMRNCGFDTTGIVGDDELTDICGRFYTWAMERGEVNFGWRSPSSSGNQPRWKKINYFGRKTLEELESLVLYRITLDEVA